MAMFRRLTAILKKRNTCKATEQKHGHNLKESDYADKWETSINENGDSVFKNSVLGMELIKRKLTIEEIEQIEQIFLSQRK